MTRQTLWNLHGDYYCANDAFAEGSNRIWNENNMFRHERCPLTLFTATNVELWLNRINLMLHYRQMNYLKLIFGTFLPAYHFSMSLFLEWTSSHVVFFLCVIAYRHRKIFTLWMNGVMRKKITKKKPASHPQLTTIIQTNTLDDDNAWILWWKNMKSLS